MTNTIAIKIAAFSALGLGLIFGLVGMAGASTIDTQGPNSPIRVNDNSRHNLTNNNRVRLNNNNNQQARTGNARVHNNTTGGSATTGAASNSNSLNASVTISNSNSCGCDELANNSWDLSTAGPNSPVNLRDNSQLSVTNNNDVDIHNSSSQTASTGNANVSNNTTGGDATSGDATNTNSTSVTIDISNE